MYVELIEDALKSTRVSFISPFSSGETFSEARCSFDENAPSVLSTLQRPPYPTMPNPPVMLG